LQYNSSDELQYNKKLISILPFNKKTQEKLIKKIKNKMLTNSDLKKIKKAIKKYKSNHKSHDISVDTQNTNLMDDPINSIQPVSSNKISGRNIDNDEIKRLEIIIENVKHEKNELNKILKDINLVENFENNNNTKSSTILNLFKLILFILVTYVIIKCIIIFYNNNYKLSSSSKFFETIKIDIQTDLTKLNKTTTCLKNVWFGNNSK